MVLNLEKLAGDLLKNSEFLNSIKLIKQEKDKSLLFGNKIRQLNKKEIESLKTQGNHSRDWTKIWVANEFKTDFIEGNTFAGECVLGVFDGIDKQVDTSTIVPAGVFKSTIINSEIGNNSLVYNTGIVSNYLIKANAIVFQTDAVIASKECTFGNGREISVGVEIGGREILSYAEITIQVAEAVATQRSDTVFINSYNDFVKNYVESCSLSSGVIESDAIIRYTAKVEDSFIDRGVSIDGAILVQNCTILGNSEEPTEISHGAYVRNSCLQWGCEITSMAIVDDSIITEHSHVERHGKITQSIIGPNCAIGEGELTSCLVGPFIASHHQSLLISAIWPEGKGNIGYGANVGSNHTSKTPDQEIWCGEGTFFGLGVNIKFPANYTDAPYSIIATGVVTLPQKIDFPFSLINKPSIHHSDISPAFNEIFPAWVLSDNIYAVKRNEGKYKKRNKARRTNFVFDVFRADIIDKVIYARNRLRDIKQKKKIYTDKDIRGLGKNYMTEKNRQKAVETYDFYIGYYILNELKQHVTELNRLKRQNEINTVYDKKSTNTTWEHARKLLKTENLYQCSVKENLEKLIDIQTMIARNTQKSKEKDDLRGSKIINDYEFSNIPAREDSFVKEMWQETKELTDDVEQLLGIISNFPV